MKKIGEGYYYNVYDLGHGRVLKKRKNTIRTFLFIFFSRKGHIDFFREFLKVIRSEEKVKELYQKLLNTKIDLYLFANPIFLSINNYEQDKVTPIRNKLKHVSLEESKKIIDNFISLNKKLWTYGIGEKVYNFTWNNGIDSKGNIVLFDFNEITFDKERVLKDIENEVWIHRFSYTHLNNELKEYYKKRMKEELTEEAVNSLWGTALL